MVMKLKQSGQKYLRYFSKYISPTLFAVIVVGIITSILLFVPPINGLGDNGSYYRVLNSSGLFIEKSNDYQFFTYFNKNFSIMQYYNQYPKTFASTQQLFISLAIWLNKIFFSSELFDIRFLGGVYLIVYLGGIYLLMTGLTAGVSRKRSYLIALFVIFILGDTSYTIYFNSFYAEAVSFLGSLYIFAAIIYLYRVARGRQKAWVYPLLFISTFVLIGSSRQQYLLIVGLFFVGLGLLAFVKSKGSRLALWAVLGSMMGFTLLAAVFIPASNYDRDLYHSLTRGVMLETNTPERRMRDGGINQQYGLAKGTSYFDEYSPVAPDSDQVQKDLLKKTNPVWVLLNYVNHPTELKKLLDLAVQDVYLVKPSELGNYEKKANLEETKQTRFFTLYNRIKAAVFPKSFGFYILFAVTMIGIYGVGFYNGFKQRKSEVIVRFFLVFGFMLNLFVVFISSIILHGDADLIRHLFLVSLYLDLITVLIWSDVIGKRVWMDGTVIKEGFEDEL